MCIAGFALMYVFSYVCAKTDSIFLLALCSLLTGFLRMVLMMVNLFTLIKYAFGMEATRNITPGMEPKDATGWNKLDIEKCISQPVVYLFFMILGQMGTALTAWLAFEYEWKYVYYFMMGILLLSILIINGKTNCSLFSKHFAQDFVLLTQNKMYILLFPIICFSDFVLSLLLLS